MVCETNKGINGESSHEKIKVSTLPVFDMVQYLDSDQAIAEYLAIVLEENSSSELAHALNTVVHARVVLKTLIPDSSSKNQGF